MKKLTKILDYVLSAFSVLCMAGFIVTVSIQIFCRTFMPTVPSWTEEVARYLFIYSVAIAGGLVVRRSEYVMVDIVTSKLSPAMKKAQRVIVYIVLMAFDLYLMIFSVPRFAILRFRMVSTALEIPMQYIYFSMFLFFGIQVLTYIIQIILEFKGDADPVKEVTAI
ncbi:MAG: TRAP transporter small permease [Clostridia bacterium]|nr:TRAP transporter small permease [Clostridia bacterium]